MKTNLVLFSLLLAGIIGISNGQAEQIHLSFGGSKEEMVAMWITKESSESCIRFKSNGSSTWTTICGAQKQYEEFNYKSPFIHTVKLTKLQPGTVYTYSCGSPKTNIWSSEAQFSTESKSQESFSFMAMGDHGTSSNSRQLTSAMMKEVKSPSKPRFIIHAGDLSYANGDQKMWDVYQSDNQRLSSVLPWMTAVGNHEREKPSNFLAFQMRFSMPANESGASQGNLYFSFNYQNAHIVAMDSEVTGNDYARQTAQYKWLEADLNAVDRKVTPWIFAYWHSPWYCSNKAHQTDGDKMREGFEDLLVKNKVDIVFNGHVHAYERTTNVYKGKKDSKGPVYITNGAGGTQEGFASSWRTKPEWSVKRQSSHWGFGLVTIFNSTTLQYQFKENTANTVLDSFYLKKN